MGLSPPLMLDRLVHLTGQRSSSDRHKHHPRRLANQLFGDMCKFWLEASHLLRAGHKQANFRPLVLVGREISRGLAISQHVRNRIDSGLISCNVAMTWLGGDVDGDDVAIVDLDGSMVSMQRSRGRCATRRRDLRKHLLDRRGHPSYSVFRRLNDLS